MSTPVTVARAEPGLLAHFPDVVRLGGEDGRLLATYREGVGHVSPDGRIRLVESTDGGRTWGRPRTAVDGPYDDRDPKLAVLADGTVLLSYFILDWSTKPGHTALGTHVQRSTDGGRTWCEPAPVGTSMNWAVSHGAAADGMHFQEPTLTVLDGQVVALIRTTGERAYLSRSTDGGHTWSTPEPTDMPASSHHALALSSGEVLVTYGDLSPRFSEHRETVGRLVRDPEKTWDGYADRQLYDSGHADQANPSSVEVSPGRFLTLGFDVPAASVIGVFTSLADYP